MANKIFTQVEVNKPSTSRHDLSHDVKLSTKMGRLTPVSCIEALPGDNFDSIQAHSLIRFAPMVSPAMHRYDVTLHTFFVPNRLLWHNWENFITNTPLSGAIPVPPTTNLSPEQRAIGSLADYLGIPTAPGAGTITVSALPFAAYQNIYDEYYRDQNLVDAIKPVGANYRDTYLDNGTATPVTIKEIRNRAWEHDYFTSCLPFAQKGAAATIPLGQTSDAYVQHNSGSQTNTMWLGDKGGQGVDVNVIGTNRPDLATERLFTEGGDIEPTTINSLRRAYALQRWLEKMARGGSRYVEYVRAHFNQFTGDARLDRPEFIYGTKSPVQVSEVLQTSESNDSPQANMAGHGISISSGKNGSYKVKEHGFIMTIMSIMPKTAYSQGLERMWSRTSNLDYYHPDFAHIGEQEVKNKELMLTGNSGYNEGTFGYIPRYAEYKFVNSRVAGDFRDTLKFWHDAREFDSGNPPVLNQSFIEARAEGASQNIRNDIFAVKTGDNLWCHVYLEIKAKRKMPYYGNPI